MMCEAGQHQSESARAQKVRTDTGTLINAWPFRRGVKALMRTLNVQRRLALTRISPVIDFPCLFPAVYDHISCGCAPHMICHPSCVCLALSCLTPCLPVCLALACLLAQPVWRCDPSAFDVLGSVACRLTCLDLCLVSVMVVLSYQVVSVCRSSDGQSPCDPALSAVLSISLSTGRAAWGGGGGRARSGGEEWDLEGDLACLRAPAAVCPLDDSWRPVRPAVVPRVCSCGPAHPDRVWRAARDLGTSGQMSRHCRDWHWRRPELLFPSATTFGDPHHQQQQQSDREVIWPQAGL